MKWQVTQKDPGTSVRALQYLESKVKTALRHLGDRVSRVRLKLSPGPGGFDQKHARVVVLLNGGHVIVSEASDESVHAAADRIADRLRRSGDRWRGKRNRKRQTAA